MLVLVILFPKNVFKSMFEWETEKRDAKIIGCCVFGSDRERSRNIFFILSHGCIFHERFTGSSRTCEL